MASIKLENVTVDFTIYGYQKSLRSELKNTVGGLIRRNGVHDRRVSVRAIDNMSITLNHGDRLGIIGPNGGGKSTLLRVCAGVCEPTQGRLIVDGKISALFNIAPGLDLDDTGYENIITCGLFMGMSREEIAAKSEDIEQFTELGDYLNLPVRTYSSGMLVRLCFAIATAIDPEILLLDEWLGAGDAMFAEKAKRRVDSMVSRSSILILASHNEALVQAICNKAILMYHGRVVMTGDVSKAFTEYRIRATTGKWDD